MMTTSSRPPLAVCRPALTTWGMVDRKLYLLDVFREKLNYPDLKRAVKQQADWFMPAIILVEDKASGIALLQDLPSDGVRGLQGCKPEGDKVMRLNTHLSWIEGGNVLLPKAAPWLATYRRELEAFPHAGNDDQVDSTSQVLEWVQQSDPGQNRFLVVPRANQLDLSGLMGAFEGHRPNCC